MRKGYKATNSGAPSRRTFLGAAAAGSAAVAVAPLPALADPRPGRGPDGGGEPDWPNGPGRRNTVQQPDAELRAMLREIDPRRIRATIEKLVSFGTRHTLSSQDDPHRGIGAARDWIAAEFRSYAAASGGRMTVDVPSYVQAPDGDRVPVATRISNVRATLRGSDEPNRVYVISAGTTTRASPTS